jgi:hypothetical protein
VKREAGTNINCDLKKGDFDTLVIRTKAGSGADSRDLKPIAAQAK